MRSLDALCAPARDKTAEQDVRAFAAEALIVQGKV
jgi:hypothetical protein